MPTEEAWRQEVERGCSAGTESTGVLASWAMVTLGREMSPEQPWSVSAAIHRAARNADPHRKQKMNGFVEAVPLKECIWHLKTKGECEANLFLSSITQEVAEASRSYMLFLKINLLHNRIFWKKKMHSGKGKLTSKPNVSFSLSPTSCAKNSNFWYSVKIPWLSDSLPL